MRRWNRTRALLRAAIVAGAGAGVGAQAALAQGAEDAGLARWKAHLEFRTRGGTVWWTSNAAYEEEDGGIDAYLMRFDMVPGGLAAEGCLWGERDGEVVGPFWKFFMGWDPVEGKGLVYQASPGGMVGNGHATSPEEGLTIAEQVFRTPDGATASVRHETREPDADTDESRSFDGVDGEWVPRRTYTWHRREADGPPC